MEAKVEMTHGAQVRALPGQGQGLETHSLMTTTICGFFLQNFCQFKASILGLIICVSHHQSLILTEVRDQAHLLPFLTWSMSPPHPPLPPLPVVTLSLKTSSSPSLTTEHRPGAVRERPPQNGGREETTRSSQRSGEGRGGVGRGPMSGHHMS